MSEPLVSIIIVNWNGKKFLADCLGSLAKISYKNKEILFVDNASTDGSVAYVKENFPEVRIFENSTNLGFAQGHDVGFAHARGEAILLLNTDTIVEKNLLSELVAALFKSPRIGAVQPKIVMYPDKDRIDSIGSFFLMTGMLYHVGREKNSALPMYNKTMEIYSAKGVCMLLRKNVLLRTGLFDKDYFAYFEETDLCHRILLSGYRILYTPTTTVYHKGGGASKQMMYGYILFHSYKNRICTYIKNLSVKYLVRVLPFTLTLYFCVFLFYLLTLKLDLAVAVQKGILWNILHIKETVRKRKLIQTTMRAVRDEDFLPKLIKPVRLSYYYYLIKGLVYYKD